MISVFGWLRMAHIWLYNMKRKEAESVGDIIRKYVENDGDAEAFARQKISYLWSEIVGPVINQNTTRRYVDGDVLHVYISSASLKSELAYITEPLQKTQNKAVRSHLFSKIYNNN